MMPKYGGGRSSDQSSSLPQFYGSDKEPDEDDDESDFEDETDLDDEDESDDGIGGKSNDEEEPESGW